MSVFHCFNYCSFYITVWFKKTQKLIFSTTFFFGFSFALPFPNKLINNLSSSMKNVGIFQLESHAFIDYLGQNGQLYNESSHLGNGKYIFLFTPVLLCVHQSQSFLHMVLTHFSLRLLLGCCRFCCCFNDGGLFCYSFYPVTAGIL